MKSTCISKIFFFPVDDCKTENGKKCIFPFNYEGTTYSACTSVGSDHPWCAYEVDSDRNLVGDEWENCDAACVELWRQTTYLQISWSKYT